MISIVIPVYNEESNVETLYSELNELFNQLSFSFQIIFVNDGSSDNTAHLLDKMAKRDQSVTIIHLTRNFGHQAAISAGLHFATGDATIIMDGDLQDPVSEIRHFIDHWENGASIVVGRRTRRQEGWIKRLNYFSFYRILSFLSPFPIPHDSGDFCLLDREVIMILNQKFTEKIRFHRGLRAYLGFPIIEHRYERSQRHSGKTKYTIKKLITLALDGLLDFTTLPLQFATLIGILFSVISFFIGIFFIFHRLLEFKIYGYSPADVPGIATLAVGLFFLGGLILMILGLIGQYIARIYLEVKNRPPYIIKKIVNDRPK